MREKRKQKTLKASLRRPQSLITKTIKKKKWKNNKILSLSLFLFSLQLYQLFSRFESKVTFTKVECEWLLWKESKASPPIIQRQCKSHGHVSRMSLTNKPCINVTFKQH